MTNKNSPTGFDQLATETILDIFDYLSCNEIIYTFFYLNQRFNSIVLQHQRCVETPSTNSNFWANVLPIIESRIEYLIITTNDFDFSLKTYPNVKSIIISSPFPIDYKQLCLLLISKQFNKLISFQIKSKIFQKTKFNRFRSENEISISNLFEKISRHGHSLQNFQCLPKLFVNKFDKLIINENIRLLSLKVNNLPNAFFFLEYTPNIKSYSLIITSTNSRYRLDKEPNLSHIKLEKFDFTFEIDDRTDEMDERTFLLCLRAPPRVKNLFFPQSTQS
jgi:hypothetical protein